MISPLELLHPDGRIAAAAVVGSACPPGFVPAGVTANRPELDAVVVAPTADEWRRPGLVAGGLRDAAGRLSPDGIVTVLAPPGRRRGARRACEAAGLRLETPLLHVPAASTVRYLVPLEPRAAAFALRDVVAVWPRRRRLLRAALRLPSAAQLLARSLPDVALVARPPGARPLCAWLAPVLAPAPPAAAIVARRGGLREDRSVVIPFAAGERRPSRVVKLASAAAPDRRREAEALETLAGPAAAAGARVPALIAATAVGGWSALAETAVAGRSAAGILGARPRLLPRILDRLAHWLEEWNAKTLTGRVLADAVLEREIAAPLRALDPFVDRVYRARLLSRCDRLGGTYVPTVAVHRDLTMFNVLLAPGEGPGIVDWEEARADALPVSDLAYAAVDAAAAAGRYRDRVAAFASVYGPGAPNGEQIRSLTRRLAARLQLPDEVVELGFHACWLGHAANEVAELGGGGGPFLRILQQLEPPGGAR